VPISVLMDVGSMRNMPCLPLALPQSARISSVIVSEESLCAMISELKLFMYQSVISSELACGRIKNIVPKKIETNKKLVGSFFIFFQFS